MRAKTLNKYSVSWYMVGVPRSVSGGTEEEEFYVRLLKGNVQPKD